MCTATEKLRNALILKYVLAEASEIGGYYYIHFWYSVTSVTNR